MLFQALIRAACCSMLCDRSWYYAATCKSAWVTWRNRAKGSSSWWSPYAPCRGVCSELPLSFVFRLLKTPSALFFPLSTADVDRTLCMSKQNIYSQFVCIRVQVTGVGAVVQLVEYWTRNQEVAGSTHTRSTASILEQVANLLCAQANSASYPQRDGKWAVATATGWKPSVADWGDGVSASCTVSPIVR